MRYAITNNKGQVIEVFDDENGNVPSDAIPLTELQAEEIRQEPAGFSCFSIIGGQLVKDEEKATIAISRGRERTQNIDLILNEINRIKAHIGLE